MSTSLSPVRLFNFSMPVGLGSTGRQILRMLSVEPGISQATITRRSGFSQSTVTRLIQLCQGAGMLVETGRQNDGPGKPSVGLALNPDYAFSFGIALTGDVLSVLLVDFSGRQRAIRSVPMPALDRGAVVDLLVRYKDEMLAEVPDARCVVGAGLGISGFFVDGGFMNTPKSLGDWALIDIRHMLEEALGMPVEVENDAAAAAIGESLFGIGRRYRNFAYLYLGGSFGGGIIADGRPFRGHHGNAGEFGAIATLLGETYPSLESLRESLAGRGLRFETVLAMCNAIDISTPGVDAWVEQAARPFSTLAGVLAGVLDPEFIVLGGRLPVSVAEALVDRMRIPVPSSRWGRYPPQPKLALAQVRRHPVATGAAALPMQKLFFA
jgi:predicted NBD/HSP70 family sugar kinase